MKEGLNVEFKRQYTRETIKTVIAFANTNGGKIYIGVEDDGKIIGIDNPDADLLMMTNAMRDAIKPDITLFTSSEIEVKEGRKIIVVEIQKGTSYPITWQKKAYVPLGFMSDRVHPQFQLQMQQYLK